MKKYPYKKEVICFTGKSLYTRINMQQLAKKAGADITHNITNKTTLLVVGQRSGSKLDRAFEKGVQIVADEEFLIKIKAFL
jgi:DNA ligase (NAD+)